MGGRGWPLTRPGGQAQPTLQVKIEAGIGKPVKGRDGIVGWMRSYGEVSQKVRDIIIVRSLS